MYILRAVARGTVHIFLYPSPKTGLAAKRKPTNICPQKSALERACFAESWTKIKLQRIAYLLRKKALKKIMGI